MKLCSKLSLSRSHALTNFSKGFTLIELVVSIGIFALMTALVVAKYGAFNQSTFLTNLAYDVALSVRTAQTYGLSVKNVDQTVVSDTATNYKVAYGIHFDMGNSSQFTFFADKDLDGIYDGTPVDLPINTYTLTQGAKISSLWICNNNDCNLTSYEVPTDTVLDLTFQRPNPDLIIYNGTDPMTPADKVTGFAFVKITLEASNGSNTQFITIRNNGQISVGN